MSRHLYDAPTPSEIAAAHKVLTAASETVSDYVAAAFKGYPSTYASAWGMSITLTGFGKVWRDKRGHRTLKHAHCDYGDWQRLAELITEAKAHYDSKARR